jgi:hypothetical protein
MRPAEKPVSAAPATTVGTNGVSSAAPSTISEVDSTLAKVVGGTFLRNG